MLPVFRAGLVVLVAAWHPSDTPCLAYFCLVTLQDSGAAISDHFNVEVTKFSPPFQVSSHSSANLLRALRPSAIQIPTLPPLQFSTRFVSERGSPPGHAAGASPLPRLLRLPVQRRAGVRLLYGDGQIGRARREDQF